MSGAQATATGTLGATPLANLLVYSLDKVLTGTMVFEDPMGRKAAVLFRGGAPLKVKLPEAEHLLSELLVEMKEIDRATADDLWAVAARDSQPFGRVLLERTGVQEATLDEALTEQVYRKLETVALLDPATVYGYYDGVDFLESYGPAAGATADPLGAIWRVLRISANPATIDQTLTRLGAKDVRLHPRSRVGRFGFDAKERSILDVLRVKPQSLSALVGMGILPESQAKRVLYGLVVTRHIDLGTGLSPLGIEGSGSMGRPSIAPSLPPGPSPAPPAPSKPAASPSPPPSPEPPRAALKAPLAELAAEIEERLLAVGKQNYYEILGVDPTAAATSIQGAFFQLAKRFHPDRLPPELAASKDSAVRLFAKMTEAHQMLANEEQRREYDRLMKEGGASADEQAEVQRVLKAASAFQKAEVLARRGNLAEAEALAHEAVEGDPDQPEYVALYADLVSQKPERVQTGQYRDLVQMVNEAKKRQPNNQRIWLYRARVLKRAGEMNAAIAEFRAIVDKDVNNVEAAREVRLHQMRKGNAPEARDRTGKDTGRTKKDEKEKDEGKGASRDIGAMFGKLFKR
ncbi:MAG TPA: J domain-containing protein [Polyangiaceae bacterium]|nr:J domain-containing protein [Polyangiaceae bacterium]